MPIRGAAAGTCDKHEGHHHHHHGDADGHHHAHGAAARRLQSDSPSGEDQGANFYGVSHFPCCITNFPQGWPKFAQSAVLASATSNAFVVASLVPARAQLPARVGGGASVEVDSSYPFEDGATVVVTVPAGHATTAHIRIPAWAKAATVDGAAAANGTLVAVPCAAGVTKVSVALRPSIELERGWGVAGERALAPAKYAKGGAVVPSTSEDDWQLSGGAGISSSKQPGAQDVRTGGPGGSPLLINRHPLYGASHRLTTLAFSFRYVAGYGDANSTAKAANLSLLVLDAVNQSVVAVAYASPPLGKYSYDDYKGYSPPVGANVTVDVPNARALLLAVRVDNNERNLQILLPSLSLSATWSDKAGPEPPAPASNFTSPPADAAVVRRGPLLYALHPHETTVVTKRYDELLPDRPQAVDYEIGTRDAWAHALVVADDAAPAAGLKFDAAPSAGWSTRRPFATDAYPFSITARAAPLPVATWGYWRGTNITAQPPPSPLDCGRRQRRQLLGRGAPPPRAVWRHQHPDRGFPVVSRREQEVEQR